jgi:hypothetical protein
MTPESSFSAPSLETLRAVAAQEGVFPEDQDLEAVLGFLNAILPLLADVERRLPPGTTPA